MANMLKLLRYAIFAVVFGGIVIYIFMGLMMTADPEGSNGYALGAVFLFIIGPLLGLLLALYIPLSVYRRITSPETVEKPNRKPFLIIITAVITLFVLAKVYFATAGL
jgi:Na+/melibiose symporter-like transporter